MEQAGCVNPVNPGRSYSQRVTMCRKFSLANEHAMFQRLVASGFASVLGGEWGPIAMVRRAQLNALGCDLFIEQITVVGTLPPSHLD